MGFCNVKALAMSKDMKGRASSAQLVFREIVILLLMWTGLFSAASVTKFVKCKLNGMVLQ